MPVAPRRKGFHSITPYLIVPGVAKLIEFLTSAFDAVEKERKIRPDGSNAIMHAELIIGDAYIMMGEPGPDFTPMPSSIYLYVDNCDEVYDKAIKAGGISIMEPMNMPSGERYGGVKDPSGNIWWVATHVEDVSAEEEARRFKAFFEQ